MNKHVRTLSVCGIVAPISYTIVVIVAGFLWSGYSHVTQAISELGGPASPNPLIMNIAGFALAGILIAAFALGLHLGINGGKGSKTGPVLVAIYGIGMLAVGFFPWDPNNLASITTEMHRVVGWTHWIALTLGLLVISHRFKNNPQWKGYQMYTLSTGLATTALILIYAFVGIEGYMGVLQRLIVAAQMLWIEIVAIKLFQLSSRLGT